MKLKSPLACALLAASVALTLTACGGGGSSSTATTPAAVSTVAFTKTDSVVGTGTEVVAGKVITVTYTGWLYSATATGNKGTQFDTGSFSFTVGSGQVITGFDQGVLGMKVGGTRTVLIPASMGYGATAYGAIPANSDLVFTITVTAVQ